MINDSPQALNIWYERLQQLSSYVFEIKPTNETTMCDDVVAIERYFGNGKQVLIFSDTVEPSLKRWTYDQRLLYKQNRTTTATGSCMNQHQIDLLNKINFIWNPNECMWDIRLNELREFRQMHGHCIIPRTDIHFPKLGLWVKNVRKRKNNLSQEQIDSLDGMNFTWNPNEHMWDIRLNELREFRKKHGHCVVPQKTRNHFPKLGKWVHFVRDRKNNQEKEIPRPRRGFLTRKQIADLDDLNFEWDVHEAKWLERFHELEEFYVTNGDTKVTKSNGSDKSLAQWVRTQRQYCKNEKRIKLLNSIGFIWSQSRSVTREKPKDTEKTSDDFQQALE